MFNLDTRVTLTSKHLPPINFNTEANNTSTDEFVFKSNNSRFNSNSALLVLSAGIINKLNLNNNKLSDLSTENRTYFTAKSVNIQPDICVNKERMVVVSRRSGRRNFSAVNYDRFGLNKETIYNIFQDMDNDTLFLNEKFYKNIMGLRSYINLQKAFKSYPEYKIVLSNLTKYIDRAIFELANDTAKDLIGCYTPNNYSVHKYVDNFRHKSDNRLVVNKRLFLDIWDAVDDYSSDWYSKWKDYNLSPQGFTNIVNTSNSLTTIRNYEMYYGLNYYSDELSKQIWLLRTGRNSHLNTVYNSSTRISFLGSISKKYIERDYTTASKKNFGLLRSMFLKTWFPANIIEAEADYVAFNPFYLKTSNARTAHIKKNTDRFTKNSSINYPNIANALKFSSLFSGFSDPLKVVDSCRKNKPFFTRSTILIRPVKNSGLLVRMLRTNQKISSNLVRKRASNTQFRSENRWFLNSHRYKTLLVNALTCSIRDDRIPDLVLTDTTPSTTTTAPSTDFISAKTDTLLPISTYSKLSLYGSVEHNLDNQPIGLTPKSIYDFISLERALFSDLSFAITTSAAYNKYRSRAEKTLRVSHSAKKPQRKLNKKNKSIFSIKLLLGVLHSLSVVKAVVCLNISIKNLITTNFLINFPTKSVYVPYVKLQSISVSRFTAIFTNYYLQKKLFKINRKSHSILAKSLYPSYILERAYVAQVDFSKFNDKLFLVVNEINDTLQAAGFIYNPTLKYLFYKAMVGRFRSIPRAIGTVTDNVSPIRSFDELTKNDHSNLPFYNSSLAKTGDAYGLSVRASLRPSISISVDRRVARRSVCQAANRITKFVETCELPRLLDTRFKYLAFRKRRHAMLSTFDITFAKRNINNFLIELQSAPIRLTKKKDKSIISFLKKCNNLVRVDKCANVSFIDNFLSSYIDNLMHYHVFLKSLYSRFSKRTSNEIAMLFSAKRLAKINLRSVDNKNYFMKNMRFNFLYKVSHQVTWRELYFDKYIQKQQPELAQQVTKPNPATKVINRQLTMLDSLDGQQYNRLNPKAANFFNTIDAPTTQKFISKWKEHHIGGLETFANHEFLRLIPDEAKELSANSDCVLDRALLPMFRSRKTHSRVLKSFYFNNESWFKNPKHNFLSQSHTQFYNRKYPDFWYKPGRKKYPLKRGKKNWAIKIPLASRTNANKGRLINTYYDSSLTYLKFIGWQSWTRNSKRLRSLESIYRYGRDGDPFARSPLADIWTTTFQIGDLTKYDSFLMAKSSSSKPLTATSYHGHSNNPDIGLNLSANYKNSYRAYSHNRVIKSIEHLQFCFRAYNEGFKTWFKRVKPMSTYSGIKTYYQYQSYVMQQNNELKSRRYKTIFSNFAFAFKLNKTLFSKNLVTLNFFDFARKAYTITGFDLCSMNIESFNLRSMSEIYRRSVMSKYKYRGIFNTNILLRSVLGPTSNGLTLINRDYNKKWGNLLADYTLVAPKNKSKSAVTQDLTVRFINRVNRSSICMNNYIKKLDIKNSLVSVTAKNALWW